MSEQQICSRHSSPSIKVSKISCTVIISMGNIRMIGDLGNKMQICTQRYGKRPYGVGLLVAGYDDQGPHIFQTCPSANYYGKLFI